MSLSRDSMKVGGAAVQYIELTNGLRIPYIASGAGPLIIFIHGSLCDYRYWQPQLDGLSAQYRCVAVSLTHYWPGASLPRTLPFGWSQHVDELAEFIEKLGEGPAHVVAHSRGGCVAFHWARRYAAQVHTLTLADPGGPVCLPMPGADASHAYGAMPEAVNALRAHVARLIEAGDVEEGLQLFVDSVSRVGSWARSTRAFRAMALDNADTLLRQMDDLLPAYTCEAAHEIRCPMLLIDGERSPDMFRRTVAALEQWAPHVCRQTIPGASHGMNLAHPAAFNRYVDAFIRAARA